jgi:putative hydroxymethylpyrimidine transport system ATP-binding protein
MAGLPGPARLEGQIRAEDGAPLAGRVALMAQEAQLLPWADLLANVTIGARLRGVRPDSPAPAICWRKVGLEGMEARRPACLSGGQRQRVALARVLMEDAPSSCWTSRFRRWMPPHGWRCRIWRRGLQGAP